MVETTAIFLNPLELTPVSKTTSAVCLVVKESSTLRLSRTDNDILFAPE